MTQQSHDLVRRFLDGLSAGQLPTALVTPDLATWTLTSGASTAERFAGGVAMLRSLFAHGLRYTPEAIVAEGDRVAVQARGEGVFHDGEPFVQEYMFLFRLEDGKVAEFREYNDTAKVAERIVPRMKALMASRS